MDLRQYLAIFDKLCLLFLDNSNMSRFQKYFSVQEDEAPPGFRFESTTPEELRRVWLWKNLRR